MPSLHTFIFTYWQVLHYLGVVGGMSPQCIVHFERSIQYRKQAGDVSGQADTFMRLAMLQVCMYVCVCACIHVYKTVSNIVSKQETVGTGRHHIHVSCQASCMYVWVYVCMYVCLHAFTHAGYCVCACMYVHSKVLEMFKQVGEISGQRTHSCVSHAPLIYACVHAYPHP